jgi:DNA-binding CsgD family transcriptional regulator
VTLLADAQRAGPVALLIDNVTSADPESLVALGFAMRRLFGTRVLVVVTARDVDGAQPSFWDDDESVHVEWRRLLVVAQTSARLELGPLGPADLARAVGLPFTPELAPLVGKLHRCAGGNPVRAMALLGPPVYPGGRPTLTVPRSVVIAVAAAVAALPAASRLLLEALAVLGGAGSLVQVARIAEVGDLWRAVEPLLAGGLIRWQETTRSAVEISHPLHQEVVYSALPAERRAVLHLAAADAVTGTAALQHKVAAAGAVDAELAAELESAAADSLAASEVDQAATYLLWAADLHPSAYEGERLRATAAVRLLWAGSTGRALALRHSVEAGAPSAVQRCARGEYALLDAAIGTAQRSLGEALAVATDADGWLVARTHLALSGVHALRGDGHSALQHAGKAVAESRTDPATEEAAHEAMIRGHLYANGPAAALSHLRYIGEWLTDPDGGDHLLPSLRARCELLTVDAGASLRTAHHAVRAGPAEGTSLIEEDPRLTIAFARYVTGEWDLATTELERLSAQTGTPAAPWMTLPVSACAVLLAAGRGEVDQAARTIADMGRDFRVGAPADHEIYLGLAEAALARARGDHRAMLTALSFLENDQVADQRSCGRTGAWRAWWLPLRVEGLIGDGRFGQAAYESRMLTELAEEVPALRVSAGWLAAWLVERRGGPGPACALYEEITDESSVDPRTPPMSLAMAELSHGRALRAAGRRRAAVRVLRSARERFTAVGAFAALRVCETEFARCGLTQPGGGQESGFTSLTERERQVADMVRRGMSNQEVASRLFVSTKTVEFHLSNIYAKLGVRSRRELAW